MTSNHHIKRIAQKVLLNTATSEERDELQAYLASASEEEAVQLMFGGDTDKPAEFSDENPAAEKLPIILTRLEKDRMLSRVLGRKLPMQSPAPPVPMIRRRLRTWYAAASVFLLLGSGFTVWLTSRQGRSKELAFRESRTTNGQHRLIVLPDGTRVYLNAASRLRYPEQYGDTIREVFLDGEAFFDVAQEKDRPFIVRADHFSAKVLGTSFDLRDYNDEHSSCVQLKTGKLQVALNGKYAAGQKDEVILLPRQQVSFRSDKSGLALQPVSYGDVGSWTEGRLIFNDRSSLGILRELERTYNIRFRVHVSQPELARRYTVRLDKMRLDKTLETVGLLTSLNFARKDSIIEVYSQ